MTNNGLNWWLLYLLYSLEIKNEFEGDLLSNFQQFKGLINDNQQIKFIMQKVKAAAPLAKLHPKVCHLLSTS